MAKRKKKATPKKKAVASVPAVVEEPKKKPPVSEFFPSADRKPDRHYYVGKRILSIAPNEDIIINNSPFQVRGLKTHRAFQQAGVIMGRPTVLVLYWHKHAPESMDRVNEWGWWPENNERNTVLQPQFAVDRDGVAVQFLDPSRHGSGCAGSKEGEPLHKGEHPYPPRNTIVIAQVGKGKRPTKAQRESVRRLVDVLSRHFRGPKLHDEWPK
jgi:hypothetical protein